MSPQIFWTIYVMKQHQTNMVVDDQAETDYKDEISGWSTATTLY